MASGDRDAVRRRPETVLLAVLLSFAGGALDGTVFVEHGVFANAQTGNLVLLGIGLARRQWESVAFLVPIAAFALGTVVAQLIARGRRLLRRPTRVLLTVEVVSLVAVAWLPLATPAWMTVVPVSFVAALQSTAFRSVGGLAYSSTMLTGNLRSFVLALLRAVIDREGAALKGAGVFGVVLLLFCVGAGCAALLVGLVGGLALLLPAGVLLVVLVLIVRETAGLEAARRGR